RLSQPQRTPTLLPYTTLFRSASASATSDTRSKNADKSDSVVDSVEAIDSSGSSAESTASVPIRDWSANSLATVTNSSRFSSRDRSEEHTSELQSRFDLVCRLL